MAIEPWGLHWERGLIIADSFSCLIFVISGGGTYKEQVGGRRWGGNRAPVRKKYTRGTSSSSHMPNKPSHQSQTITEDEANDKRRSGPMLSN